MSKLQYFKECIESSFDEHGIIATNDQILAVASDVQNSYENIGLAFYTPESPFVGEVEKLKKDLEYERALVFCETCNGRGRIQSYGPHHGSNSECHKCNGRGKHLFK